MGQLSKPTRDGYKLKDWAETSYEDWRDLGGCTCFLGCAPCQSCTHEGHPYSLEEIDEAWKPEFTEYIIDYTDDRGLPSCEKDHCAGSGYCVESCPYFEKIENMYVGFEKVYCRFIEEEPNEMSRDNITNKGLSQNDKPKSEWFGFKYKVNPETSKLLQEAVFKDGGKGWDVHKQEVKYTEEPALFVYEDGRIIWGKVDDRFRSHNLPEKEPPQPSKSFLETVVKVDLQSANNTCVGIEVVKARPESKTSDFEYKPNLNFLNQQEESNMSNKVNRRVLNIQLLDNDAGLPVEHSLVAEFNGVVTEDSNEITLQEIISTGEVAKHIEAHNKVRAEQVDQTILQNTGQTVKLRPVKLKDLTWNIK